MFSLQFQQLLQTCWPVPSHKISFNMQTFWLGSFWELRIQWMAKWRNSLFLVSWSPVNNLQLSRYNRHFMWVIKLKKNASRKVVGKGPSTKQGISWIKVQGPDLFQINYRSTSIRTLLKVNHFMSSISTFIKKLTLNVLMELRHEMVIQKTFSSILLNENPQEQFLLSLKQKQCYQGYQ